ncbi:MAG: penicillin-binding protein, partial [Bacteroidota bacterium]|nr:penicillin-binding protein [Bacteroidota bacterium]
MPRLLLAPFLALLVTAATAQLGGSTSFRVLDIPSSARTSALGGNYIAVYDSDINLGIINP